MERVKCTVQLPRPLWRDAKVRALDEGTEFQIIVAKALEAYLKTPIKRVKGKEA
jgi:hypothetical protein